MSVVRQQALTVVAPIEPGREQQLDAWLRQHERELLRGLSRSSTTHFARWVLLPPTPNEYAVSRRTKLLRFETNFAVSWTHRGMIAGRAGPLDEASVAS